MPAHAAEECPLGKDLLPSRTVSCFLSVSEHTKSRELKRRPYPLHTFVTTSHLHLARKSGLSRPTKPVVSRMVCQDLAQSHQLCF
jgi:hypothetical protein